MIPQIGKLIANFSIHIEKSKLSFDFGQSNTQKTKKCVVHICGDNLFELLFDCYQQSLTTTGSAVRHKFECAFLF